MLISCLVVNFDVLHAATGNRYADNNDIRFFNLGPITLFSSYKLTTSSRKHLKDITQAHLFSLMFKLITSAEDSDDLFFGFDRYRKRRQRELTKAKVEKNLSCENYAYVYIRTVTTLKKAKYGLGCILTLTRKSDNSVLDEANATNSAKIKIRGIEWYVRRYTQSIPQKAIISKQILRIVPTELQFVGRSVFMKEINSQNESTFEIRTQKGKNVPSLVIVGFQQKDRRDSQILSNDTFYKPPTTISQFIIWMQNILILLFR